MNDSHLDSLKARIGSVIWYHRIELAPGLITPGINDPRVTLGYLDLPAHCRGMRVLDIGTRDGFFAFELERRGADVVAVDYMPRDQTGFAIAANALSSNVQYLHANIYDLGKMDLGQFDIVLFLGLLYHLPDPIEAINIIRRLCGNLLCVETHAIDNYFLLGDGTVTTLRNISPALASTPLMRFYPGETLNNDASNYWGPNLACVESMLRECRFEVTSRTLNHDRAIVNCRAVEDERRARTMDLTRRLA